MSNTKITKKERQMQYFAQNFVSQKNAYEHNMCNWHALPLKLTLPENYTAGKELF